MGCRNGVKPVGRMRTCPQHDPALLSGISTFSDDTDHASLSAVSVERTSSLSAMWLRTHRINALPALHLDFGLQRKAPLELAASPVDHAC